MTKRGRILSTMAAALLTCAGLLAAPSALGESPAPERRDAAGSPATPDASPRAAAAPPKAERKRAEQAEEKVKDEARRLWREGLEAARGDDVELARLRFAKSLALYPHAETLRNLALVELASAEHTVEGATHLAEYLALRDDLPKADREQLEATLAAAEKKVGRLELDVEPEHALLEVDGQRVAPPLASRIRYVSPGKHRIEAWLPGARRVGRDVEVHAGQSRTVLFVLDKANGEGQANPGAPESAIREAPLTPPPAGEVSSSHWPEAKLWAVIGGSALTAVALGVGIYGEVGLASAKDDVREARDEVDAVGPGEGACFDSGRGAVSPACRKLDDAASDQERVATVATAGWIATGALAAGTAAVWLLWPNEPGATSAAPWVSDRELGWVISGRF